MPLSEKRVQVVYRNYIPLNAPYSSFWTHPPKGVRFIIPQARPFLRKLYPIYDTFRNNSAVRFGIKMAQKFIFANVEDMPSADAYFFIGMLPERPLDKPYYVDIEHALALINFISGEIQKDELDKVMNLLLHPNCKGIVPISFAAKRSIGQILGREAQDALESKTTVIYPALPCYYDTLTREYGSSSATPQGALKLLFVGNQALRKGLYEVLEALETLEVPNNQKYLTAVTRGFSPGNGRRFHFDINIIPPRFSNRDLMEQFMLNHDVFVMPTYLDSFGMVFLEAMSCGLPVIATSQFAVPEIITNGVEGFLLKHPPLFLDRCPPKVPVHLKDFQLDRRTREDIVRGVRESLAILYSDPQVRATMAQNGLGHFRPGGKFSVDVRNEKLLGLFESR